jgi:hypothetical protein
MTRTEYITLQKVLQILHVSGINSKVIARGMISKLIKEYEKEMEDKKE